MTFPTAAAILRANRFAKLVLHWLKCHLLQGNTSACATEDSLGACRGLSSFSPSETSASREEPIKL